MPAANRSAIREAVCQSWFECEFRNCLEELEAFFVRDLDEMDLDGYDDEFAKNLVKAVDENQKFLRERIEEFAPDWPYDKIARMDRAVLQIGLAELFFVDDVPEAVTLNEFVEIAKNYAGDSCRRFVNGVLSSAKKSIESKK